MYKFGLGIVLAVITHASWAQSRPSSLSGTVSDAQHLAVPQVSIELMSGDGQTLRTGATDQDGHYIIEGVAAGRYSVRFRHAGFKMVVREATLTAEMAAELSVTLDIPSVEQTVTVDAAVLSVPVSTSSRLDLPPLETPAAIYAISSEDLIARGANQVEEAVRTMPGAYAGGTPEAPSGFLVRGFSNNQIVLLRDGIYAGPAGMITRPQNSFNLQSIELLSGPSSVLYGQGAVGGTINEVTKPATFTPVKVDGFASYGSFNTYLLGVGAGGQIKPSIAFRGDLSYSSSDGFVKGNHSDSLNGTGSLLWKISPRLNVRFSMDALKDNLPSAYGTPYVPASFGTQPLQGVVQTSDGTVLDARMRYNNYNVADGIDDALSFLTRGSLHWEPLEGFSVTNEFYYYHANRYWRDADSYQFLGPNSGQTDANGTLIPGNVIARDRFHVYHKENLPGDTLNAALTRKLFGLQNKLSGGFQYYNVSFLRSRGFPNATYADYVDPFNPSRGSYGNFAGDFPSRVSPTTLNDRAGFFEDALTLTRGLTLVTGIRFESVYLNRLNFLQNGTLQASTSFSNTYNATNYRAGLVYHVTSWLTGYGQFSTGEDPAGSSNIFLVNASQNFKLSSSTQGELGLKSILPHGFGEATLAVYSISRNNILTQTALDVVSNVGSQRSRGVEFSSVLRPMRLFTINLNTAYTNSKFGYFLDTSTQASYSGNHPPNVPDVTANVFVTKDRIAGLPLDVGGGLHYAGTRYADFANRTRLLGYTTCDVFANVHITGKLTLGIRGRNISDKAYGLWADTSYPGELLLGAPRSVEVSVRTHF